MDRLPMLRHIEDVPQTCSGGSCVNCTLHSVCSHRRCPPDGVQRECKGDCGNCGGGVQHQWSEVRVPAICCKSPLKDIYLERVRKDSYSFKKRKALRFDQKYVVMHHGLFGGSDVPLYPDGTKLAGVNLRHVWTPRGWHSQDMKDFLRIPPDCKLILFSCTYDTVLEKAMENEVHYADFEGMGFDYWEIYELSHYYYYSNFFNLWMGYRALYMGEASNSWFMQPPAWGLSIKDNGKAFQPWTKWAERVPQMTVNWQFTPITKPEVWYYQLGALKTALKHLPAVKSLWFQGVASGSQIYNIKRAFFDYDCYFITSSPWMRAHQRKEFTATGGFAKSKMERLDLLMHNQRNFANLVDTALTAATRRHAEEHNL